MRTSSASLQIADVTKRFGEVVAVDAISLDIASGEFLTLLGPSGSGKTTTLLMIAGFEEPTAGAIALDGRSVTGIPSYRRGFGMVFQNYALFPHMTVSDNVGFPLKMRKIRGRAQAQLVARALELVRLPGYGGRYPNQLSGGQQQRVALARALVFNPPVLLMDEPLGALDKKLREEMQLEIKRLQSELGITTIYVTHDQEEALVMSDRIAVMNAGQIEQVDTPTNLYEHPATRFVADFIGESNLIPITVRQVDGSYRAETPGQHLLHYRADAATAGDGPTSLVVRPEKVRLGDEAAGLDNLLSGTVSEVIYVGDTTKYRIRIGDDFELTVKRHNRAGQTPLAVADTVRVGWRAEDGSLV